MAAEGDHVIRFNYTGEHVIPRDATHITIDASVRVIPEDAFRWHRNIVEVICGPNVEKIEARAFNGCQSLRRIIMPGVEVVGGRAFHSCFALMDVECGKLEIIKRFAFGHCTSLSSIDLPSTRIVEGNAFNDCKALKDAKFGSKLETIEEMAFYDCRSLKRITIPLKDGMMNDDDDDDIFYGCDNLKHVDLAEGPIHETIAALHFEEWKNDMNEEIDSINQILSTTPAGGYNDEGGLDEGGKARAIRTWIRSVLGKMIHYKAQHQHLLDEAATALQLALPQDIVMKNVLPFLELP